MNLSGFLAREEPPVTYQRRGISQIGHPTPMQYFEIMFSFYDMNLIWSSHAKKYFETIQETETHGHTCCRIFPLTILTLFPYWPNNCLLHTKTDLSVGSCWLKSDSTDPWGLSFPAMRTVDRNDRTLCYSRNYIWNLGRCTENTIDDLKRSRTDPAPPCLRPQAPCCREHGQCLDLVRATSVLSFCPMLGHGLFSTFHGLGLFPKAAL